MQEMILKKGEIMDFNFYVQTTEPLHDHQDIELFYVVEGTALLTVADETYTMQQDDFIIINSNKRHSYLTIGEALIGCIHISYQHLHQLLQSDFILFWCNTIVDKNEFHIEIRKVIKLILNQYYEKKKVGLIYLKSLYYELLHILTSNFLISTEAHLFATDAKVIPNNRQDDIVQYVKMNYHRPISLNDLGEKLFLSSTYLSKYIKKQFGMNFMTYLNNERLHHAMEALLYSDLPITRIALDNGFANTAAFNKVFRETYHTTPSKYQAEKKETAKRKKVGQTRLKNELLEQKIQEYYERCPVLPEVKQIKSELEIIANTHQHRSYTKNWQQMINMGEAVMLLRADVQEHLKLLNSTLGFTYVRFWDIWDPEMYLDIHNTNGHYNFDMFDKIVDFLVAHQMKPYLEMGFKPRKIISAMNKTLFLDKINAGFESAQDYQTFVKALLAHCINRYGMAEVETWIFELWKDESNQESLDFYYDIFDMTYKIIKSFSKNIRLGGAGLSLRFGMKNFYDILKMWEKRKIRPDFLSLYLYPYVPGEEEGTTFMKHSTDSKFVKNQLMLAEQVLEEIHFSVPQLHVTEWNLTVSQRNTMNDSCFKGAYVMKSIIESIDHTNFMGYWIGSDLFGRFFDSKAVLGGGGGLMSKDGIKKPAYYAFEFMNQLGDYLIHKDDQCMVTTNGHHDYFIVCHNYKHFNYQYFMKPEDEIDIRKQNRMFNNQENLQLAFRLQNVREGTYRMKVHAINQSHGSVQDEWLQMDCLEGLSQKDLAYLEMTAIPKIHMKTISVTESVLKVKTILEPNEIQLIQLTYQY